MTSLVGSSAYIVGLKKSARNDSRMQAMSRRTADYGRIHHHLNDVN